MLRRLSLPNNNDTESLLDRFSNKWQLICGKHKREAIFEVDIDSRETIGKILEEVDENY